MLGESLHIRQGLRLSITGHLCLNHHLPIILTLAMSPLTHSSPLPPNAGKTSLLNHPPHLRIGRDYSSLSDMRILDVVCPRISPRCNFLILPRSNRLVRSSGPRRKEKMIKYELSDVLKIQKPT